MKKFVLIGAALMMFIPGLLYLVAPQMMLEPPAIKLQTINDNHLVRAAYGGGFLGIAALFILGVVQRVYERTSLLAIALLLFGFALGRVFSIVVDGTPAVLFLGVLIAELIFGSLAVVVLRKES